MKLPEGQLREGELAKQTDSGSSLKGHLPKVSMPSLKMPKVELKGPDVEFKGPKVDLKGPKSEVSASDVEVSPPCVEVDIQAPGAKVEGDLGDRVGAAKDSKFKMPKFKMPSFGVSAPAKPTVEVAAPKVQSDVALPFVQGELKTPDVSIQLPSSDLKVKTGEVSMRLSEGQLPEGELATQTDSRASLKGHMPKVSMPSLRMPKVELKGPDVELKGPKVDLKGPKSEVSASDVEVSPPCVEVDIQVPGAKVEGDLALADKDLAAKDSKFRMPKFKMPSFGMSAPGKPTVEASLEVAMPKVEGDVDLPTLQGDVKTPDISIQLPSCDMEAKPGQVGLKLPEGQLPEGEIAAQTESGAGLKGHLSKVSMPSVKMPKVELKGTHVDIKDPKVDVKGPKGKVSASDVEVSLPGMEVDIQVPEAKVEGDLALADKDLAAKDSKFKMPKFKMPSFGVSTPGKPTAEASLEVAKSKVEADVALTSIQGDLKTPDLGIQLPSPDLEVKAGMKLPKGQLPEGELAAQIDSGAGLKDHLPKVSMPSVKMPTMDLKGTHVDIKGPKVHVKGPKGEVSTPDMEVSLPGMEVDIQVPEAKVEGDLALADKDLAAKDSKFKMPKFKMPSFGVSAPGKPTTEASLEVAKSKVEADVALPSIHGDLKTRDLGIQLPSADLEVKAGMKLSEGHLPVGDLAAQTDSESSLKGHLPKVSMPSVTMSKMDLKGTHVDLKGHKVDVKGPNGDVSPSHVQVFLPGAEVDITSSHVDVDVSNDGGAFSSSRLGVHQPSQSQSSERSHCVPSALSHLSSTTDVPQSSLESIVTSSNSRIMFPKFHKPKFAFSLPPSAAECDPPLHEAVHLSGTSPDVLLGSLRSQVVSPDASLQHIVGGSSVQSERTPPPEGHNQEGKRTSFKLPRIKLPPFSRSPKKEAGSGGDYESQHEDPTHRLGSSTSEMDTQVESCVSSVESHQHGSLEKDTEKGRTRKSSFSMPRLALPKIKSSKVRAGVPREDGKLSLSGTTPGSDLVVTETAVSDTLVGDTRSEDIPTEPYIRASTAPGSQAELPSPTEDLGISGDSESHVFVGDSASLTAPIPEGLLQPPDRQRDSALTTESPEVDPTAKEMATDSSERRFTIPKFQVPGLRRSSSKDQGGAGELEVTQDSQAAVVSMPLETEVTAGGVRLSCMPESKVEAHVSLRSPEEGAGVLTPEGETYAAVVKRDLRGAGSRLHSLTSGASQIHLPTPGFGTHLSKGALSLEMPGVRVSEPQLPLEETGKQQQPRPGGNILAEEEARTGSWPSQPQGPLRLKASLTELPSQVSVVSTSQLWEDSVLTVTIPKLKVPRFSFHAPSSEADVFFPVVREVQGAEASIGSAMHQDSPGLWEARILKTGAEDPREPPASLEQSLEVSPISKVRVHIQGSQGESQEVTICSRVEQERAGPSAPGAFSTQIVRESEIPASTVQTPSYGFSLLKVKIPEPTVQASVYTVAPNSQMQESLGGDSMPAAAGGQFVPGDVAPDTGEPFEVISSSVGVPPLSLTPEVRPAPQLADSTSDEEPAEILEFPEDSQDVKTPDMDTKQKPEGKKASLLWSWLPSIGFSSVEEMAADSRDTSLRSAPVHVQPAARLDPELPRKQEKAGWFRFPKLGFSSSPTKKTRSSEDEEGQAEHKLQEETITFFDARESFSPEEEEAEPEVTSARPRSKAMVASSARTELALLERAADAGDKSTPKPVVK
nr:protein AHNAK2 isoform X2 [Meriones unguiculatus]